MHKKWLFLAKQMRYSHCSHALSLLAIDIIVIHKAKYARSLEATNTQITQA